MPTYGLLAAAPVRWLLSAELDVRRKVEAFAAGFEPSPLEVAGPPSVEAIAKYRKDPRKGIGLPTIKLHMKMVNHHLTGERGIEVKCSDADMDQIIRWHNEARFRAALAPSRMQ